MPISIMPYERYFYIKVNNAYELMAQFTQISESPNAETTDQQYIVDKSKTTTTTSYATQWAFEGVAQKDAAGEEIASAKAIQWLQQVGELQKLGEECTTELVIIDRWKPIASKEKTYYARYSKVSAEITDITAEAGSNITISGNLNGIGDIVEGEFNIESKTFTPTSKVS